MTAPRSDEARAVNVTLDKAAYEPGEPIGMTLTWGEPAPASEPAKLRIGWSCPISSLPERLAKFPGTTYIRIFRKAGLGPPAWADLDVIPKDVVVHVSVKDRGLPVAQWLAARPPTWTVPVVFTLDHEPEQQDSGDPLPAEYREEWAELCNQLAGHSRRGEIILCPTFTRYAAELDPIKKVAWFENFGQVVDLPGVDAIGMDVYDPGSTAYQTSTEMYDWSCDFAEAHGKDLYGAEWGRDREGSDVSGAQAGTVCAQKMRDDIAYLRTRPRVRAVAWFYTGGDNLDTGAGGGPRLPEREALAELIAGQ